MDEPGLFGVTERLFEVRTRKTDVMTDAFGSPPRMRALVTEAVNLGDEHRRAPKTVSGDHLPMVPQWYAACQPLISGAASAPVRRNRLRRRSAARPLA